MPGSLYQSVWGRAFPFLYEPALFLAERRGLRDVRRELIGRSKGRVVELGAGTGLNLDHYRDEVSELILTEPDHRMAAKLRRRLDDTLSVEVSVENAPAEQLPFDDDSVDTVVSTLVLCTVRDPRQALAEVSRVLRPGGSLLFAEHVRSPSPRASRWQDRLNTPWSWYACGCQCNRDTVRSIRESSFQLDDLRVDRLRWISPVVRPLVIGSARSL
jgi:ubiquinone/menaquinone biosynthesis C-methylase UbiE